MPEVEYYSGKNLVVTSAKLAHKDSTYPVSAVTAVSVSKIPAEESEAHQSAMALGAGLVVAGLAMMLIGVLNLPDMLLLALLGPTVAAGGAFLASWGHKADTKSAKRRDVTVQLASGRSFSVRAADPAVAGVIKHAIETAITARETGSGGASVADELEKLSALRAGGVLTAEEWGRAKDLYLGKRPDKRADAIVQMKKLYELHQDGVLSLSEFNSKKWDILIRTD
ncbi:MAG: DUF6232 family protein [Coriobacteriia bacterium]|nr:DUF6232 family protein [Coriobacteriia bacterium]